VALNEGCDRGAGREQAWLGSSERAEQKERQTGMEKQKGRGYLVSNSTH